MFTHLFVFIDLFACSLGAVLVLFLTSPTNSEAIRIALQQENHVLKAEAQEAESEKGKLRTTLTRLQLRKTALEQSLEQSQTQVTLVTQQKDNLASENASLTRAL